MYGIERDHLDLLGFSICLGRGLMDSRRLRMLFSPERFSPYEELRAMRHSMKLRGSQVALRDAILVCMMFNPIGYNHRATYPSRQLAGAFDSLHFQYQ